MAALVPPAAHGEVRAVGLRCEYRVDPLGIDLRRPRLSWAVESEERARRQAAYRIVAGATEAALEGEKGGLWDSGKVASSRSLHIPYGGELPGSCRRVHWKVRVWDGDGKPSPWSRPAFWETGMLDAAEWKAKWIGDAEPPPAVVRGRYGYRSRLDPRADAVKWVGVDLGARRRIDAVRLHPARLVGASKEVRGHLFPERLRVEVSDSADFTAPRVMVAKESQNAPADPLKLAFTPVTARALRLVATRLRRSEEGKHGLALAEMEVLDGERNIAGGAAVKFLDSTESGVWSAGHLVDGDLVSHGASAGEPLPCPYLRREFSLPAAVKRATACVSALGLYELRLNGRRVGDQVLAPEWTSYHKRVQYQVYDVTRLLQKGENAVGAILGDGWYAGRLGIAWIDPGGPPRRIYGSRPRFLLELRIELADGSRRAVVSDGAWRVTSDGPIRRSCILDGELQDARKALHGWDRPGFDDSAWEAVAVEDLGSRELVAQPNEPIAVVEDRRPIGITEPDPLVFIFDMGQNMVGWTRLAARGPAGTVLTLRHAETLDGDGRLYTANLRGAAQTDAFILRGEGEEVFEPHFTYHGFRYVEVRGLEARPALDSLTGRVVHSSARATGSFSCSSPVLTKLMENIAWTQRGNMHSTPTDCPQRDERMGWLGDAQVFSQTACFNRDMAAFFTKWLRDVRDDQAADGRFPDFAPHPYDPAKRFSGAPAWADGGVIVPWRVYINYGDTRILEESLDAARRWVDYVRTQSPELIWTGHRGNDYNDWLNGNTLVLQGWPRRGGEVPKKVFATAFFAHSTELVSKMARALGRLEDAQRYGRLAADIEAAFQRAFIGEEGRIQGDTQAGYALALHFGLVPDRARAAVARRMAQGLRTYKGHLSTGIQSTVRMLLELTANGYNDLAYRAVLNRAIPSWCYMVDHGATTVWERWDGYVEGRGFQDPGMNSFNHYAFGSVGEWVYRTVLGIHPREDGPGYARFTLGPRPGGGLSWARGSYDSIRGRISVSWRTADRGLSLEVSIPANTRATVYVPAPAGARVTEGGIDAAEAEGVELIRRQAGAAVYEVGSGRYRFEVR